MQRAAADRAALRPRARLLLLTRMRRRKILQIYNASPAT